MALFWMLLAAAAPAMPPLPAPVLGHACPTAHAGHALSGGVVYDGPPEDMAVLKEDRDVRTRRGEVLVWPVGTLRDTPRDIHLGCRYGDDRVAVVVRVPHGVETCRYVVRGRHETLGCR